jgi:hypothetical protein
MTQGVKCVVDGFETAKHPLYSTWKGLKSRCYTPGSDHYQNYGGRGIRVCERWLNSFSDFVSDLGAKPSPVHTLEREDNNGNYEPSNVVWATRKQQMRNTRRNKWLTYNDKTMVLEDWAKFIGISVTGLYGRIYKDYWSIEKALSTPLLSRSEYARRGGLAVTSRLTKAQRHERAIKSARTLQERKMRLNTM